MTYKESPLFGLSSKRVLKYYLKIPNSNFYKQSYVAKLVHPYLENKNGKKRLIEKPDDDLKRIQTRLKRLLAKLDYPEYIFSGVRKRSYVDNAKLHKGNKFLYKIDLTAFFPSVAREKVFIFFRDKLCVSPDIAEILTNFTTIDLDMALSEDKDAIDAFLQTKGVKTRNHLISGSPTSQLLSYLANQDMIDKLQLISQKNNIYMSVYVDDIIFSSSSRISMQFKNMINNIIGSQCYHLSTKKAKTHTKFYPKKVTGVVINKFGNVSISNSLRVKLIKKLKELKANPQDNQCRRELRGLVEAARQVIPNAYPSIYAFAYDPQFKLPSVQGRKVVEKNK